MASCINKLVCKLVKRKAVLCLLRTVSVDSDVLCHRTSKFRSVFILRILVLRE
jgi:hypothetical protein